MRLQLECNGVSLWAREAVWLDEAMKQETPESKLVVDLRKVNEFETLPDGLKDKGIKRVSIPITAASWSEQDMDMIRREFLRGDSPVVVLSRGGTRAALIVLQHVARVQQWSLQTALEKCPELAKQDDLKKLLDDYLQRHQRVANL